MAKVIINYSLKNKDKIDKRIKGIKKDNHLLFNDDGSMVDIEIIENDIIINRENEETINRMYFGKKNYFRYYLKRYNKYVNIDINLISLNINNNEVEIMYKIEDELFEFKIYYEVI